MTWMIRHIFTSYEAVEIVRETEKCIFFVDRSWRNRRTRSDKHAFLDWRGDEAAAKALADKLKLAYAELNKRTREAHDWFAARRAELIAEAGGAVAP